ncbi:Protein AGENET DOMAIN (AGD)-CONTAINING P1 [Camellia lanceoleosa]|uniref:Protein AGENET DOMAIN (AGD)-CONTAINING P1 n=1 Tax=Camellia lanceoleosa TaxID=1840588 RepID=A0ACC0GZV2_9ERIC|nr:Protein AGENET DOMAIN (AGD)-CONTAINING P1 [Camellia lanceoleosa]
MRFRRGDRIEVASKEDGFVGSYYSATVISELMKKHYMVQYKTLLKEDEAGPLREIVAADEVRPVPPEIPATGFGLYERVDAFDNDGWWVGKITGRLGPKYYVYFEKTGDEIAYPLAQLRIHQDWLNDKWV